MDYGLAFTFIPNSSKDWISKSLMGVVFALLTFVAIGVVPLLGWGIAIARHVIHGDEDVLPEWSELGQTIIDGLKFIAIFILWYIPVWILVGLGALIDVGIVNLLINCCAAIYGVLVAILALGVFGLLADDRPFGEALNPANAWTVVSANWASTIIVWLLAAIGATLATTVSIILCGIGIVLGMTYGYALIGHLYGQLYREAKGGEKLAAA
jgi:hypothetical protein